MFLTVNGLRMRVERHGEGGEPILLLHGALSDYLQNWRMVLGPLSARHALIAIDMRGHGQTDNPSGRFTLRDLAEDALAVLDALELPKAHVLGASLGGYVGLALRSAHPERVGSLALAGVKVGWTPEAARSRADFFTPEAIAESYPSWLPHLKKAHARPEDPEHWRRIVDWVSALLMGMSTEPAVSLELLAAERGQRGLFYAVGDRDSLVPLIETARIREARPDAEILVLPRAGHLFREYSPAVFVPAYLEFLRRHRLGG